MWSKEAYTTVIAWPLKMEDTDGTKNDTRNRDGQRAHRARHGAIGGWMWGGSNETDTIRTIRTALDLGARAAKP